MQAHLHPARQRRRLASGESWTEHGHGRDHFVLWLIAGGKGRATLDGHDLLLSADQAVLVPPGLAACIRPDAGRTLDVIHVRFDLTLDRRRVTNVQGQVDLDHLALSLRGLPTLSLHAEMPALNLGQQMLSARHHIDGDLAPLDAHIQLLRVIHQLRMGQIKSTRQVRRSAVDRAYVYLLEHRGNVRLSLEELARHVGISVPHLTRRFRQKYGQSPMKVLARERLAYAKRLLATPEFQVGEVASACGYGSTAYFCRLFRADTGQTPSQYRRRLVANPRRP